MRESKVITLCRLLLGLRLPLIIHLLLSMESNKATVMVTRGSLPVRKLSNRNTRESFTARTVPAPALRAMKRRKAERRKKAEGRRKGQRTRPRKSSPGTESSIPVSMNSSIPVSMGVKRKRRRVCLIKSKRSCRDNITRMMGNSKRRSTPAHIICESVSTRSGRCLGACMDENNGMCVLISNVLCYKRGSKLRV